MLAEATLTAIIEKAKHGVKHPLSANDIAEMVRFVRSGSRTLDTLQAGFIVGLIESREVVSPQMGQQMAEEILRLREENAALKVSRDQAMFSGEAYDAGKKDALPTRQAVETCLRKFVERDVATVLVDALVAAGYVRETEPSPPTPEAT